MPGDLHSCWCGASGHDLYRTEALEATCSGRGFLRCLCAGGDGCFCHHHGELTCPGCGDCYADDHGDEGVAG